MKNKIAGLFTKTDNTPKNCTSQNSESFLDLVDELTKYGRVMINQHDDGTWSCRLKMNLKLKSSEFDISSGYQNKTIQEAVLSCITNLNTALKEMRDYARQV